MGVNPGPLPRSIQPHVVQLRTRLRPVYLENFSSTKAGIGDASNKALSVRTVVPFDTLLPLQEVADIIRDSANVHRVYGRCTLVLVNITQFIHVRAIHAI